jgi:DNA-binding XRE family transcriptional regulator
MTSLHDRSSTGSQPPAPGRRFISLAANGFIGAMAIGERLTEARESKGLTQAELVRKSGVAERTLRDIESGVTQNPSTAT